MIQSCSRISQNNPIILITTAPRSVHINTKPPRRANVLTSCVLVGWGEILHRENENTFMYTHERGAFPLDEIAGYRAHFVFISALKHFACQKLNTQFRVWIFFHVIVTKILDVEKEVQYMRINFATGSKHLFILI